jgi:type II secretory pathway pseudopilin PulG
VTRRAGFTLLETMLAATIAALVVLVLLSVMFAMERSERVLAARAEQSGDLQRARLVMQRVSMNILMSSKPPPRKDSTARATAETGDASKAGDKGAGDKGKGAAPAEAPQDAITPRLILDADPRLAGLFMSKGDEPGSRYAIQRLEVVLTDSPVPSTSRDEAVFVQSGAPRRRRPGGGEEESGPRRATRDEQASGDAAVRAAVFAEEAQGMVRAPRGALEFWPQTGEGTQRRLEAIRGLAADDPSRPVLWDLWWVPLPPRSEDPEGPPPPEAAWANMGEPYLIASNIRFARWTAFDDREKKVRLAAARRQDLPAYVELEMETAAGLRVHWMFETDCAVGPEVPPTAQELRDRAVESADGKKADTPGAGRKGTGGGAAPQPTGGKDGGSKGGKS